MTRALLFMLLALIPCACHARDYSAWLGRCAPWRAEVEAVLERVGVSRDYYYLMAAESGCREGAQSRRGAQGFWQMMPRTGRRFGCGDLWDVACSTAAAARYIRHLEARFVTFRDVVHAYNMGGHNYARMGATAEAMSLYARVMALKAQDNGREGE